jgi:manganese/iron transport system ATP-binding protein
MSYFLGHHAAHDTGAPALSVRNLTVKYGSTVALDNVSFDVRRGDQVAIVGPNGAGKSTLFNAITGIAKPTRGQIEIYGSGPEGHICIGYVPQRNRIDWRFPASVYDTVMMGRVGQIGLFRWPSKRDRAKVAAALEQVGLQELADRPIGDLSGGQQQRVFLARALAQEAELLLLDEPLTGLDTPSQEAILTILDDLRRLGTTMLIATHDLQQAAELFPLVMLVNRSIVAYGPAAEVLTANILTRAYGSHVHVVHTPEGDLLVTDTCCSGGQPPVENLFPHAEDSAEAAADYPVRVP